MLLQRNALFTESYTYQGLRMNDPQGRLWNNEWLAVDRPVLEQTEGGRRFIF